MKMGILISVSKILIIIIFGMLIMMEALGISRLWIACVMPIMTGQNGISSMWKWELFSNILL